MALARRSIGSYQVVRALEGHGREVLLATRPAEKADNRYVLALFEVDAEQARHLEREVVRTMELDHPSITRAVELFEHDGKQVIVYEGVPGCTLHRLLGHLAESGGKLSDGAAIQIGVVLFRALNAAHTATDPEGKTVPMVHAQLGLPQLFVSWTGEVRLLGMGLSTIFRLAAGLEPAAFVAQPFMAPEVRAGGALTVRANVYSAAAILWALLTGKMPPVEGAFDPLRTLRPDLDKKVTEAIDKALEASLVKRTIGGPQIVRTLDASGLASLDALRAEVEPLRALDTFEGATIGAESFPPAALSDVPPGSLPPLPSLLPDGEAGPSTLPPESGPTSADAPTLKRDVPAELLPKKPVAAPAPKPLASAKALPKKPLAPMRAKQDTAVGLFGAGAPPAPVPAAEGSRRRLPAKAKHKPRLTKTFGTLTEPPASDPLDVDVDFESRPPPADADADADDAPTVMPPKGAAPKVAPPKNDPPAIAPPAGDPPVIEPPKTAPKTDAQPEAKPAPKADTKPAPKPEAKPAPKPAPEIDPPKRPAEAAKPPLPEGASAQAVTVTKPKGRPAQPLAPEPKVDTRNIAVAEPPPDPLPEPPPRPRPREAAVTVQLPARPAGVDLGALTTHGPGARAQPSRAKWMMFAFLGMALTFGAGVWVGGLGDGGAPDPAPPGPSGPLPEADPATTAPAPPEPEPAPAPEPPPEPIASTAPAPDASATAEEPPAAAGEIPDGFAMLRVDSTVADAYVYVGNEPIGPVGVDNQVRCGAMYIRLGTHPLTRWLGPGRSISLPCRTSTQITMVAGTFPQGKPLPRPSPAPKPTPKGWTPDDL